MLQSNFEAVIPITYKSTENSKFSEQQIISSRLKPTNWRNTIGHGVLRILTLILLGANLGMSIHSFPGSNSEVRRLASIHPEIRIWVFEIIMAVLIFTILHITLSTILICLPSGLYGIHKPIWITDLFLVFIEASLLLAFGSLLLIDTGKYDTLFCGSRPRNDGSTETPRTTETTYGLLYIRRRREPQPGDFSCSKKDELTPWENCVCDMRDTLHHENSQATAFLAIISGSFMLLCCLISPLIIKYAKYRKDKSLAEMTTDSVLNNRVFWNRLCSNSCLSICK